MNLYVIPEGNVEEPYFTTMTPEMLSELLQNQDVINRMLASLSTGTPSWDRAKVSDAYVDTAHRDDPHMKAMGYVFDEPTYRWVKP